MDYATRLLKAKSIAAHRTLKIWARDFTMFARNGRWGTCGGCPHDAAGNVHPEFCECTERHDHQLKAPELAQGYDREYKLQHDRAMQEIEELG